MIKIRDGEMNYKNLEELSFYFMFISCCLTEKEVQKLKDEWNKQGGFKSKPWWQFVMENTKIQLDINKA